MAFLFGVNYMKKLKLWNWVPALIMMGIIFWFSAQPSTDLPNFNWADKLVKKSGHVTGYAILAFLYWYGLGWKDGTRWLAWLLAIFYGFTDEFHQSFVFGRTPSIWDVLIFDNIGMLLGLWLGSFYVKQKTLPDLKLDQDNI